MIPLTFAFLALLALYGLAVTDRQSVPAAVGSVVVLSPIVAAAALICAGGLHV